MEENQEITPSIEPFSNRQLDESVLPSLAHVEFSGLEKNLLTSDIIATSIFFIIPIIVELILQFVVGLEWFGTFGHLILLGLVLLAGVSLTFSYFSFFKKSYAIREKDIIYNSGLFWQSSIVIPFNRVQHCEVSIGPIDRLYKLSELKIFTAGGSSSDLSIHGLRPDTSNRIKDFIVHKTSMDEEE